MENANGESSNNNNNARLAIMELANMISVPMSLNAVVKLKVADAIWQNGSNAPLSPVEILAKIRSPQGGGDAENLQRILRMLTSYGVFKEHVVDDGSQRRYSLTEVGKTLVTDENGLSHGSYVLQHHQDALMRAWTMVHEVVNDSSTEPFVKANGEPAYNYYGKNSEMNSLMLNAMSGVSVPFIKAILEGYDGFQGVKTLVDVGGSGGDCLKMILEKHTNIELGINFDLPEVVEKAPQIPRLFWQLAWHAENKAQYVRILETCSLKVNVFASVGTFLLWKDNYGLAPVAKYLCSFWSASIMLILSYLYRCKSEGLDTTKPLVSRSTFLGLTQLVFSVGLGERNCATYFIQVFVVLTIGVGIFDTGAGNDLPTRNSVDAKILVHLIVVWAVGTCPLFIPWYTTLLMVNLHNTFMVLHSLRSWIKQLTMISIQHYGLENKTEHMWLPLSYGIVITLLFNGIDGKKYVSPYESDILLLLTLFYLNLEDKVLIEGESIVVNRVGYVMAYGLEFVETNLVGIIGPSKMLERLI